MSIDCLPALRSPRPAWDKSRLVGQKRPLLPRHVWSIRVRLELSGNKRDLALFNMSISNPLAAEAILHLGIRRSKRVSATLSTLA